MVYVPIALFPMAGCIIYITRWCLALRLEASDKSGSTRSFVFHIVVFICLPGLVFLRQRYLQTAAVGCDRPEGQQRQPDRLSRGEGSGGALGAQTDGDVEDASHSANPNTIDGAQ
jgi:hypothetical protein